MKAKTKTLFGVTLILIGLGVGTWYWYRYQSQKEQAELDVRKNAPINTIKAIVRHSLKDPDSAIFDDVTYNPKTGAGCGFVNAKNSFGGYTGSKLFFVDATGNVEFDRPVPQKPYDAEKLAVLIEAATFNDNVKKLCLGQTETEKHGNAK